MFVIANNMLSASMSSGVGRSRAPKNKEVQNPGQKHNISPVSPGHGVTGNVPGKVRYKLDMYN